MDTTLPGPTTIGTAVTARPLDFNLQRCRYLRFTDSTSRLLRTLSENDDANGLNQDKKVKK